MPRSRRVRGVALLGLTLLLAGCATGVRGELRPDLLTTGNETADQVLTKMLQMGNATYTADYESTVQFDQSSTKVSAAQDGVAHCKRESAGR